MDKIRVSSGVFPCSSSEQFGIASLFSAALFIFEKPDAGMEKVLMKCIVASNDVGVSSTRNSVGALNRTEISAGMVLHMSCVGGALITALLMLSFKIADLDHIL